MSHLNISFEIHPEDSLEFYSFIDPNHPLKKVIYELALREIYYYNGTLIMFNIPNRNYDNAKVCICTLRELDNDAAKLKTTQKGTNDTELLINAGYLTLESSWPNMNQ